MLPERKETPAQKYEYRTLRYSNGLIDQIDGNKIKLGERPHLEELLTAWGAEGWDLTASLTGYHGLDATLVFKRPAGSQVKSSPETP